MKARQRFLGRRIPGHSWLHRSPAWTKLGGVASLSVIVLATRDAQVNAGLIVLIVAAALSARLPLRELVAPVWRIGLIIVAVVAAHLWLTDWTTGLRLSSTIVVCILAAALLMLSTTVGELIAVFEVLAWPLRFVGLRPATVGLAAGLVVRSLPVIADLARVAGDSARARGLDASLRARTIPLVLGTVKYAQDTGRALEARGLG
ncbi:energy-coupling factor transporter transmembrane component T family protein [Brevibacterium jeotgali]|uniref:Biotin transport system permease protein n=1 Tax=Brevibacterium jeotgali TaxID=1262550 RepID=A0A2H1L5Y8_9MICO|nr:energy-coupling factor transporter transmembrane protein EcfT [Brevibacterium jeotgali]TWB98881.1 biotin transport system permease protein [Brevibacterium jeotgali]SMY12289.1 biotin transport system permease protein [Brevibacterium jeotgali]